MSTTRSPSPPAPATERADWGRAALVLVGHGSSRTDGPGPGLLRHAAALRDQGVFAEVRAVVLHGGPNPEEALAAGPGRTVFVAPLLMCDGVTAKNTLPRALGLDRASPGRRVVVCPPLGLQPSLSELIVRRAREDAMREGLTPAGTTLLLVAHGSPRDPASRGTAQWHAARARAAGPFTDVRCAFLEEDPLLSEVLAGLGGPAIAVGLFAAGGQHAVADVPRAIRDHARQPVRYIGAIGDDPAVADLVLAQVAAAASSPQR